MATATLTAKGQTTIPKDIRRHLGLKPGDQLNFLIERDGRVVLAPSASIRELKGCLSRPKRPVSVATMKAAIRRRAGR